MTTLPFAGCPVSVLPPLMATDTIPVTGTPSAARRDTLTLAFLPFFTVLGAFTVIRGTTLSTVTCTCEDERLVAGVPDVAQGELVRARAAAPLAGSASLA